MASPQKILPIAAAMMLFIGAGRDHEWQASAVAVL
jgi:hypothetical protein